MQTLRRPAEAPVTGGVRNWLRAEGIAAMALSALLYGHLGSSWWLFFGLLFTPDLIMVFYLLNPQIGAATYNLVHSYALPLGLAAVVLFTATPTILPYLCVWTAHIGMDRCMGYGLKYPTAFGRTHLGFLRNRP